MLDIQKHKVQLSNLLLSMYKDSTLAKNLGFKGGTACYFFYDLPRFSVDLDFDLIKASKVSKNTKTQIYEVVTSLVGSDFDVKQSFVKKYTMFWLLSYEKGERNIKIEINKREFPNSYNVKNFYGTNIRVLKVGDIIAHKLVAIQDRKVTASRDIFDSHYFLKSKYASEINQDIIKYRTGLGSKEFYSSLLEFIESYKPKNLLSGIGELLEKEGKEFVRSGKLLDEFKSLLRRQIEFYT